MLLMPDFANVRRASEMCSCGSNVKRGECCHAVPYAVSSARTMFDDTTIEPSACVWQQLHPTGAPCDRCPHCVGFPCLSKLQKVVNHPSLLLIGPKESSEESRKHIRRFAQHAFTPEMLKRINPDQHQDGRYERTANLEQLADT